MNFYISKIRLWFKQEQGTRDLDFYQDKVNVITGNSSTGKSSVLKIIDYCLLSERSAIVKDVINENVAWYGLVFYIDEQPYTIIRPSQTIETDEMKAIFRKGVFLPEHPEAGLNDIRSKVVIKMNELFNIPKKLKLESKVKLNYRHNLMFNYLTEDIIATENTYQDLRFFRKNDYMKVLNDLFKLAIGVDELKRQELENELKTAQRDENKRKEAQKREQEYQEKYEITKLEILKEIDELGLNDATSIGDTPEAWAKYVKTIVDNCNMQFKDEQTNMQRKHVESELEVVREELGYFESLEREYRIYQKRLERQSESLMPLDYIKKHLSELMTYQETSKLLHELTEAWQSIKESYVPEMKLPDNYLKERDELKKKEHELRNAWNKLNPYAIDQKDIIWLRKAILLADRMERELAKEPKQTISEEMLVKCSETISSIEEKLERLKAKNDNAINNLNEKIDKYFKYQRGISEAYRDYKPVYSIEENILMLEREEGEFAESNIGSKSNYMFLHLCYFFGLHDLLLNNRNNNIPQFLFIDQPSIPYYADKNDQRGGYNNQMITNDDQEKLVEAFRLTDLFMREMTSRGHFQIIMIEHAGTEYWQNLSTFETRYEFRNGEGLIPSHIINKKL